MSIHPALGLLAVFAVPTVLTAAWRPGVERAAQERAAPSNRLARHLFVTATTAPPGKEVRVTGIGDRLAAMRRAAWEPRVRPRGRGAHGERRVAHAGLGDLRRRVRRRRGVRRAGDPRGPGRRAAGAGGRLAAVGVHRRHGGRDRLPARDLARRLEAAGLARGLRGRPGRARRRGGAGAARRRHPLRARLVRLSRHGSPRARGRLPAPRAGLGGGRSWARTAPARPRW